MNIRKTSPITVKLFMIKEFVNMCFENIFTIKKVKNPRNKYIIIFNLFKLSSICLLTSYILRISPIVQAMNMVKLYPKILIEGIAVNMYKHINSIIASIKEFLRIIPCLLSPFNIPNIVTAGKNIGAASEANLICDPKSVLP